MAPESPGRKSHREREGADRALRREARTAARAKKGSARKKTGAAAKPATRPGCFIIGGKGSCPEWEDILPRYPMIDSVQREDFPEQGASFAYLAHFYCTDNTVEESSRAQDEFEAFFKLIGYEYDYAGNFESRWFEGIGVRIR